LPALDSLRLVGTTGSNRAMEAELKRIAKRGLDDWRDQKPRRVDEQTLVYPFDPKLATLAVNYLRTPARVLWDFFEARARRLEPLFDEVRAHVRASPPPWLRSGTGISVRARDVEDFPASRTQIQGTIKNAIIAGAEAHRLEVHLETERPDVEISVRGTSGTLVLSADLAGRSLHERGYRLDRTEASLRENLAAQMLMLARWDARKEALVDPMCGAGTFAIEGAAMARGLPLWVGLRPDADRLLGRSPTPALFGDTQPFIVASDHHAPAVEAARKNARRAGVDRDIVFMQSDYAALSRERIAREVKGARLEQGLLIVNPPYGERLEPDDEALLDSLYAWARGFGPGWRLAVLTTAHDLDRHLRVTPILKKPLPNAPLRTTMYVLPLD